MSEPPHVSVILPVYNGAAYIIEAVRSILDQTYGDFELLLLDDGSSDNTLALLAPLAEQDGRLQLLAGPRRGLVGTLNHGISLARGSYIARMDADDAALPQRFEIQVAYLNAHPDCVALGTSIIKVDEAGAERARISGRQQSFKPAAFPPIVSGIPHPTAMIRSAALRSIGGYRPYFYNAEDRDLWARLWQIGRVHQIPNLLLRYRVHGGSVTRQNRTQQLLSYMMADMSALARYFGLDDQPILDRSLQSGDKQAALDAYAQLIGSRYPVNAYRMYHCIRNRMWLHAPFASTADMIAKVAGQAARRPFDIATLKLLAAAIRHGPASQRLGRAPDPS